MMEESALLYRPVGQAELELIRGSDFKEFPPRLPEQPFFYPVLNEEYAIAIARDWNTRDPQSGNTGYVLRFKVRTEFIQKYAVRQVGDAQHREYWIPAADLTTFNQNLIGAIEVIHTFRGKE
jgi:hypothetical protein